MGVFTARPTFTIELGAGASTAHIELCADRSCTESLGTFDVTATAGSVAQGRPTTDLPAGRVFWHARSGPAEEPSAVWQFLVRRGAPGVDTSALAFDDVDGDGRRDTRTPAEMPVGDVNGDGFSDLVGLFCPGGAATCPERALRMKWGGPSTPTPGNVLPVPEEADPKQPKWVDALGDVNRDGYADAALTYANPINTWVLLGSKQGFRLSSQVPVSGMGSYDHEQSFGGDFNGDGFSDYVATPSFAYYPPHRALVHFGGPKGIAPEPSLVLEAPASAGEFGSSIIARSDINHDGFADVVIGAYRAPVEGSAGPGGVYVFFGGKKMSSTPSQLIEAPEKERRSKAEAHFGITMKAADSNGDGTADLYVSTACYGEDEQRGYCNGPRTWLYLGGPSGLQTEPAAENPEAPPDTE